MDYRVEELKKEGITLSDWEYEFQQRGEQPILLSDWFSRAVGHHFMSQLELTLPGYDYLFTDSSKGHCKPHLKQLVLERLKEVVQDPAQLELFLRNSIEVPRGFNEGVAEINAAIAAEDVSSDALASHWEKMDANWIKVIPWFWFPYYLSTENFLTNRVREGLENYRKEVEKITDFDEALLALVFPTKKTGFQLEQEQMLKLVLIASRTEKFEEDETFIAAAEEYLKQYDWLTTFILTPLRPMTFSQLVGRVEKAIAEKFAETYAVQKVATARNEEVAGKILALISSDASLLKRIEDARELGYVLTVGIEEAYVASSKYLRFMELVAGRIGVAYEDLKYLLSKEIVAALRSNTQITEAVLATRREGFIMGMIEGRQYVLFGKEGHEISTWVDTTLTAVDQNIKELKGQVACKGYSKAKVRIALSPKESHELLEGEVLVCPMTNPDYVPAMRRASAIVTDEGGLLSHAAIMSREFNKPCVIGTKIATKLLENGMEVEVDAKTGIVRILD